MSHSPLLARRRPRHSLAGLTMIEALIAVGVLMVAVLSALSSQVTSLNLITTSRETNTALSDLQAAMEQVLLERADEIPGAYPADTSLVNFDDLNLQDERIVPTYPGFVVGDVVPDPLPIVLTISWSDYGGRPRFMTLSSMKTR